MNWVYLSPHFDDVALSCGGLVWEQVRAGEQVNIWTICAGEPPVGELSPFARQLHARWEAGQDAPPQRKAEDIHSCNILGASYRHFKILDCIYRRAPQTCEFMYASEKSLNGVLHPGDEPLVLDLSLNLSLQLPSKSTLVCPLGMGNHVDHQLTRLAAEDLGYDLLFYADFPYVLRHPDQLSQLAAVGWNSQIYSISAVGLQAWQDSIAAHASQISTFWASEALMRQAIHDYCWQNGGVRLWAIRDR